MPLNTTAEKCIRELQVKGRRSTPYINERMPWQIYGHMPPGRQLKNLTSSVAPFCQTRFSAKIVPISSTLIPCIFTGQQPTIRQVNCKMVKQNSYRNVIGVIPNSIKILTSIDLHNIGPQRWIESKEQDRALSRHIMVSSCTLRDNITEDHITMTLTVGDMMYMHQAMKEPIKKNS